MSDPVYVNKTKPQTLGYATGDFLKWEATPLTRIAVPAAAGTKVGALVEYPLRGKHLVALTNESDGLVVVQPHNCVIDLTLVSAADINTALGGTAEAPKTAADLAAEGDVYGIVYQASPAA